MLTIVQETEYLPSAKTVYRLEKHVRCYCSKEVFTPDVIRKLA